jgi:putative nucleotidyltransferase with HDIG domain
MNKSIKKIIPSIEQAELILEEAEKINPGPWISHSRYVAKAANIIALNCEDMDAEVAYVLGLLHDIGKMKSVTTIGHISEGYNYCVESGYEFLAKTCVTHSCPTKSINDIFEVKENNHDERHGFVESFLDKLVFDDYDRLIQLCDAIALPDGFTLIEKRLIDVALRHDVTEYTIPKWKAFLTLREHFDQKMGKSIYSILPGVIENTFGY